MSELTTELAAVTSPTPTANILKIIILVNNKSWLTMEQAMDINRLPLVIIVTHVCVIMVYNDYGMFILSS